MNLKTKELERYSRQIIIKDIGISGQKKIKNSKVLIVGLGGLGCPVAEYLSRTALFSFISSICSIFFEKKFLNIFDI